MERTGDGAGKVTSAPAGIDCGTTCKADLDEGTEVTLTATPDSGSTFGGWAGACTGTAACVVKLAKDTTVTATFAKAPPQPRYTLAELSIAGGAVQPRALNGLGDVVGGFMPDAGTMNRAFLYDAATRKITFLAPDDRSTEAVAVNDAGMVVVNDVVNGKVFRWFGGTLTPVPTPVPGSGKAINATGTIVGWLFPDDGGVRGFVDEGTEVRVLHPAQGAHFAVANGVNRGGTIVGASDDLAARFTNDVAVPLPLPKIASAEDVNDSGLVVGISGQERKTSRGFVLDLATGATKEVSALPDDLAVFFTAVNGSGVVVGDALRKDGSGRAVVYADGQLADLGALVASPPFQLETAVDVNDRGEILVWGRDATGRGHTAVLTPR